MVNMIALPTVATSQPVSFILPAAAIVIGLYLFYLHLLPKPVPGVPYNKEAVSSILGDIPSFTAAISSNELTSSEWLLSQAKRHSPSPICQLFIDLPLGLRRSPPMILVSDYREAQDVLLRRKGFDRSDLSMDLLAPQAPDHHINLKTDHVWKAHRRLIQDLMLPTFLHSMAAPNIYRSTLRLVDLWREKERRAGERCFNAEIDVYHMALDAVLDFTFADALPHRALPAQIEAVVMHDPALLPPEAASEATPVANFTSPPLHEFLVAVVRISEVIGELFKSPFPRLSWKLLRLRSKERKFISTRENMIQDQIRQSVERLSQFDEGDKGVKSAIDMMMLRERQIAEKEGREPQYFSRGMIEEILGFIIAGHDTTSTTLSWLIKFLTDNQPAQTRLRNALTIAHADAYAQRRVPTVHEIISTSIPYLDAVMEEGLRCSNTFNFLERQVDQDTELLGHHFKKGTIFIFFNRGPSFTEPAHNIDEKLRSPSGAQAKGAAGSRVEWDHGDMDAFRPERWLDQNGQYNSTAGPSLPFGNGTRGCYGRRLAYLEMRILLTLVTWNFELQSTPKGLSTYDAVEQLTYRPKQCFVKIKSTGLSDGTRE